MTDGANGASGSTGSNGSTASLTADRSKARLKVYRGDGESGEFVEYETPMIEGMVVLDAILNIQAEQASDLAVRWNCKAAHCGSCSAEINGVPKLLCKTRIEEFEGREIQVQPLKAWPVIKDLVSDVSWNYEVSRSTIPFHSEQQAPFTMYEEDVERLYEPKKCIECFMCQDVCHVLRTHEKHDVFAGPRFFVRNQWLEMHPMDDRDRLRYLKEDRGGVQYCNITKCCTEVCPVGIKITDNSIIPLKERVADEYYDPAKWLMRKIRGRKNGSASGASNSASNGVNNGS